MEQDQEQQQQDQRLSRIERMTLRMSVIQTVLAVTVFCVAIIALYAALNEADAVRKQQQASVWPYIELRQSFRNLRHERIDLSIRNSGIGPAKIETVDFFFDGDPFSGWDEAITRFAATEQNTYSYETVSGRVMRPDQQIVILSLIADEMPGDIIARIQDALDSGRLSSRVCYCSVFDECWSLSSKTRTPTPVKACLIPAREAVF